MVEIKSKSLNQKAWARLKRNTSAMFGLAIIILAIVLSVFAYAVVPDNSPSGNGQILPLETQPPGFKITLLKIPSGDKPHNNIFSGLVSGFEKNYDLLPVTAFTFEKDSLHYIEFKGKAYSPAPNTISFHDLLGPSSTGLSNSEQQDFISRNLLIKRTYWLGTDKLGRDILSRLIIGTRVSLSVGLISVAISLLIGVLLGALAGFYSGSVDQAIMFVINVFWSIPTLLLAMGLYISAGSLVENKLVMIFIAVGLTMWVDTARIVRGQFIAIREQEFVTAATSLGYSNPRIIFKHMLPNILGPVIVVACANFAAAILVESGLSYIGLGIQPPAPSWGSMLNEYKDFIDTNKAYLALFPGAAIMLLVLAFNLLGNGLRDALDVKGRLD